MQTVSDTLALSRTGRVLGFADWLKFTITKMNKTGPDLVNAVGELVEARRLSETIDIGQRVRVGGDLKPGRSFDVVVEDAAGTALRHIDVTTAKAVLEKYRELSEGIRHGIAKARSGVTGSREITIRVTIRSRVSLGRGRFREMNRDGAFRVVEADGRTSSSGNVLAAAAENLPTLSDSHLLDRVNVVNADDGTLVGVIENSGGTWNVAR